MTSYFPYVYENKNKYSQLLYTLLGYETGILTLLQVWKIALKKKNQHPEQCLVDTQYIFLLLTHMTGLNIIILQIKNFSIKIRPYRSNNMSLLKGWKRQCSWRQKDSQKTNAILGHISTCK